MIVIIVGDALLLLGAFLTLVGMLGSHTTPWVAGLGCVFAGSMVLLAKSLELLFR